MFKRGMEKEATIAALLVLNKTQCRPPLPNAEVVSIVESVSGYEPTSDAPALGHFRLTDYGNAERLVSRYGGQLRFSYEREKWLVWDQHRWQWDHGDRIATMAKSTVRGIYNEAADETSNDTRQQLAHHARQSESDQRLAATIKLAQSEWGIPVRLSELDADPWFFNCFNGTVDLRTGLLLPHRKEDLITAMVDVPFDLDAKCPIWMTFLDRVTGGSEELASYLQRAVGYSLTGVTKLQILFFLYGTGSNGKTTFMNAVRRITGPYGDSASAELFMAKERGGGSGPKEGLANLMGKRFVVASELEEGKRLATGVIKDMTGGETVKADRKYEHEIEYQPQFKLWLVGNHKPAVTDTTLSTWRRVKLIPFTVTIPDDEVDPDLPSKLEAELPGILAWTVRGCLDWQQFGLQEPELVTTATAGYRAYEDRLGEFIEDLCVLVPTSSIAKATLKEKYEEWCHQNGYDAMKQRSFRAGLIEKGITEGKTGSTRYWRGITLKETPKWDMSRLSA